MSTTRISASPTVGTPRPSPTAAQLSAQLAAQQQAQQQAQLRHRVVTDVAGKLEVPVSEVAAQLSAGSSLAEVARSAGVPRGALLETIKGTLSGANANAVAGPRLDQVAAQIADATRSAAAAMTAGRPPVSPVPGTPPVDGAALDVKL